eukprot:3171633-Rhodomonas_salina.3
MKGQRSNGHRTRVNGPRSEATLKGQRSNRVKGQRSNGSKVKGQTLSPGLRVCLTEARSSSAVT